MGNSPHHHDTLQLAADFPGWLWLHDIVLGHAPPIGKTDPTSGRPAGILEYLATGARGLIVHSGHAAQLLRENLPADFALPPVSIVPLAFPDVAPGVVADRFQPPWIIAHFGHVNAFKLADQLVRAFAALPPRDHRLVFVGHVDDNILAELRQLAAGLGVAERITYTGRMPRAAFDAWLNRAQIAVQMRSRSHGESSAAINSLLAAGTPVITNIAAAADWPCEVTARVSAAPDVAELSGAISKFLAPAALARQSAAALQFAAGNSYEKVAARILEIVAGPATPRLHFTPRAN